MATPKLRLPACTHCWAIVAMSTVNVEPPSWVVRTGGLAAQLSAGLLAKESAPGSADQSPCGAQATICWPATFTFCPAGSTGRISRNEVIVAPTGILDTSKER